MGTDTGLLGGVRRDEGRRVAIFQMTPNWALTLFLQIKTLCSIPTKEVIMNELQSRRAFLADVSKGTLLATIGPALAVEFGITSAHAEESSAKLNFGDMEALVCFMQETPVSKLQPA